MSVHSYSLHPVSDAEADTIRTYCESKSLGEPLIYIDAAESSTLPLAEREAGSKLVDRVMRGDDVVVASLDRLGRSLDEAVGWMCEWRDRGVNLHVLEFGGAAIDPATTLGQFVARTLAVACRTQAEMTGASVRRALDEGRRRGFLVNGRPPYGFRAVRDGRRSKQHPRGRLVVVPDPEARALMGAMVRWYDSGLSLDAIRQHVDYACKLAPPGTAKIWTKTLVSNLIAAERRLRAVERPATLAACDRASPCET